MSRPIQRLPILFACVLALFACCASVQQACAQQTAVSITNVTDGLLATEAQFYSHGFKFIPDTDIFVNALGYYDNNGDGLAYSCAVGIFDAAGTLLTSTIVASGTTAPLTDEFRYTDISSLQLKAGQTYTAGGIASGPETLFAVRSGLSVSPSIFVYPDQGVYTTGRGGLHFPVNNGGYQAYLGPNFRFTTSAAVPAPGALLTALVGSLPGVFMLVRRIWKGSQGARA